MRLHLACVHQHDESLASWHQLGYLIGVVDQLCLALALDGQLVPASWGHYFARASCSASSSQALTRRITASRAGTPFGNSAWRSASRLIPLVGLLSEALARPRLRVVCDRVVCAPLLPPVLPPLREPLRARVRRARVDAPTTPWARLRCAPSEAGRVKVLPHSGHVSAPSLLAARVILADVARLALAIFRYRFLST